jgi:hypothetical protein
MSFDPQRLHFGIFGPGLSGKTTLAKYLSWNWWLGWRVKSLVHDINGEQWGPQAFCTSNSDVFWDMVWRREVNCAVFVEEAGETIDRDREKTSLFTRVRHRDGNGTGPGHRLVVVGHSGANLLPTQRDQIHTLYLFRQSTAGAEMWAEQYCDERIMEATTLNQYEFLYCRLYHEPERLTLRL